jgi:thiosulfate/3-mercaptopyruvate sulfurtransferase
MRIRASVLICLTFLLSITVLAATPRESLVVTDVWLAKHLNDPDLVLLHIGDKAEYEAGHIAGARLAAMSDVSVSEHSLKGLILEMPPAEDLRKDIAALGISDNSRVVIYYGKDWVSPTTRIIYTLDYAGLGSRVSLLDGGMGAWVRNGGAVTKVIPPPKTGTLAPLKIRPIVVDASTVRARIGKPGVSVVDGRASVFYDGIEPGEDHGGVKERPGHIPGALSIPYTSIVDDQFMLKSPEALAALFTKAGVKPGDTVIGYCHIGMQTTAMLFAARTLGHSVLLYDGSFQDWYRHPEYPVENPAAKAGK